MNAQSQATQTQTAASQSAQRADAQPAAQTAGPSWSSQTGHSRTYTVRRADTLSSIATRLGIAGGYSAIAQLNNLANPSLILVGQVLRLPEAAAQAEPAPAQSAATAPAAQPETPPAEPERPRDRTYTVRGGDNLTRIATQFHVEGGAQALAALNNIADPSLIHPGQVLRIPPAPTAAPETGDHTAADRSSQVQPERPAAGGQGASPEAGSTAPQEGPVPKPNPAVGLAEQDATVLMAMNLYAEARGEYVRVGANALYAIAQVVMERVRIGRWGGSTSSVILAPSQFSWTRTGDPNLQATLNPTNNEVWEACYRIAGEVMGGGGQNPVGGSDHYHADYVMPNWADGSRLVARVGRHLFYDLVPTGNDNKALSDNTGGLELDPNEPKDSPIPGESAWIGKAVIFNRRQTYNRTEWEALQRAMGTTPDGDPGHMTARAVYRWQAVHGLERDGALGAATKQSIESASGEVQQNPTPTGDNLSTPEQQGGQTQQGGQEAQTGGGAQTQQGTQAQQAPEEDAGYVATTDELVNQIQRQHPQGLHVVVYGPTNNNVPGGYANNTNNQEFTTQALGQAAVRQTVGNNGALALGVAMPAISRTQVQTKVNTTYTSLLQRYQAAKPEGAPTSPQSLKVKNLSLFYHGTQSALSLPGENISNTNVGDFVDAIRASLRDDVGVQLYACSAARGENSLAENMADELSTSNANANVYGHTSAAHTTENSDARVFGSKGQGTGMFDIMFPADWRNQERERIWGQLEGQRLAQANNLLRTRLYRYYSRVNGLGGGWNAAERTGYQDVAPVQNSGYYASRNLSAMGRRSFVDPSGSSDLLKERWREWARGHERSVLDDVSPLASTF